MNHVTMRLWQDRRALTLMTAVISVVWSLVVIMQHPMLNDDAYGYLRAAQLFQQEGAEAVFTRYGWYGYSILIGLGDYVLPGELKASAHVIDTALITMLVLAFIACAQALQPGSQVRVYAASILLFPLLNEMRFFVIRDFGFWAFALLSLHQLLQYRDHPSWRNALWWCLSLLVAAVFRLEALLLAALTPLGLVGGLGWQACVRPYAVLAGATALLLTLATVAGVDLLALIQYAYRFYLPLLTDLPSLLSSEALALNAALFSPGNFPGTDDVLHGIVALVLSYAWTLLANLANALGLPLCALVLIGWWRGWLRGRVQGVWSAYVIVSVLSLFAFLCIMHFLTQRYATFLCLLLLLWLPTLLQRTAAALRSQRRGHWLKPLGGVIALLLCIDSLFSFGHSQRHLDDAVAWSIANLPADMPLVTNDLYIAYETGRVADFDQLPPTIAETLRVALPDAPLIIVLKANDTDGRGQLDLPNLELLQRFANDRGDEVRIFHVH